MNINSVMSLIGTLGVTSVVAAGAAWACFRYLGDKWISNKFSKQLEASKHEQKQELEQLRLKINTAFDRTIKIHVNEFEVLSELWARLNEAYGHIISFVSPLQTEADLDRLSEAALDHFLNESGIPDYQIEEVKSATNKREAYRRIDTWKNYQATYKKFMKFERYFRAKGIFVQQGIKEPITLLSDLMWDAMSEKRFEEEHDMPREGRWAKGTKFREDGPPLIKAIGRLIEDRLWEAKTV